MTIDYEAKKIFNTRQGPIVKIFDYRVNQAIKENKSIIVHYWGQGYRLYKMTLTPEELKLGKLEDKPVQSKFGNYTYKNYSYPWKPDPYDHSRPQNTNTYGQVPHTESQRPLPMAESPTPQS